MKKFKIILGVQKLDVDFDGVYPVSDFYPFPKEEGSVSSLVVKTSDKYNKYTIYGILSLEERLDSIKEIWRDWLEGPKGEIWLKNLPDNNNDNLDWIVVEKTEEME